MSESQDSSRITPTAACVFVFITALLFGAHGNRFVWSNDEGIILGAAARMLNGQTLYRDFFGIMAPGSYWIQEGVFALFGVSIRSGRIIVIVDFALHCSIVFWLTAILADKKAAFAATLVFAVFQAAHSELLLAQHRMDSAALALLSIALCVHGQRRRKTWYWAAGGLLVTAAALCTPNVGCIAPVTLVWVYADRTLRRFLAPYCAGLAAGTLAILTVLIKTGMLKPMIDQLVWLARNYSAINYMPYGSVIGGYGYALADATGLDLAARMLVLFCLALPAVLPVVAIAAWAWILFHPDRKARLPQMLQSTIGYLLGCMVFLIASAYPRSDVAHLAFVAGLPYVLAATWVSWYAPRVFGAGVFAVLGTIAIGFIALMATRIHEEVPVATPIGTSRVSPADLDGLRKLLECVHPGDTLYVHPYRPMLYVLTQAHNPTRYLYVLPGVMTSDDAAAALKDLETTPPKFVIYLQLERADYLRVFPNAYNANHRFSRIEDWIAREYVPVEPAVWLRRYRLYQRSPGTLHPAAPSCAADRPATEPQ